MKAIVIREPGAADVLELRDVPSPSPGRGEVRVRVRATAVNRADVLQRKGMYPAPPGSPADIPGIELAGDVEALGDGVVDLAVGDRVFGLVGGGSYAEEVVVHARALAKMPSSLDFKSAAAIPEATLTAYDAMVAQAGLAAGETVLVHAIGSGVGTAAAQIALAIGARCIGTARTASKLERARPLGMDVGILATGATFANDVLVATGGRGVDVVLELVGGSYVAEDLACLAPQGRLMLVGLVGGARGDIDLGLVLRKRLTVRGTVLRARPLEERILTARMLAKNIVPLVDTGAIVPVIDCVLPLASAAVAHARMEANEGFGKIVLVP